MKYLVRFIVVTFFILICTHTFAEQKIAIMDLTFVLNNSEAGKGAQDFLKKSYSNNIKKFTDVENNLKKEESDLLTKKTVISKQRSNYILFIYRFKPFFIFKFFYLFFINSIDFFSSQRTYFF